MLSSKVAMVTGASSGIGRAVALAYAAAGAKVVVSDTNSAGGEETVGLICKAGGTGAHYPIDGGLLAH
jgi:NAD(P)-dependent dehydrogenase (short-subunit alcohol dehydrogenase family)